MSENESRNEEQDPWKTVAFQDDELGGSNDQWIHTLEHVVLAAETFQVPDVLAQFILDNRLKFHPEIIRFFHRVGKTLCPVCSGTGPAARA